MLFGQVMPPVYAVDFEEVLNVGIPNIKYKNDMSQLSLLSSGVNCWPVGGEDAPKKVCFEGMRALSPLKIRPLSRLPLIGGGICSLEGALSSSMAPLFGGGIYRRKS